MEIKAFKQKAREVIGKYRYAVLILLVGIVLMVLPGKKNQSQSNSVQPQETSPQMTDPAQELSEILSQIQGVGKVKVMLTVEQGQVTLYQCDEDMTSGDDGSVHKDTVIVSDSDRNQSGLIQQVNPPKYRGAIVVCQGADHAQVKLAVTEAVSRVTGLGTDRISVLKMK